ncbi:Transposon Ty3-I Gag-Pol [Paramuricea clavata]|uniref:Transposon Ty3-I Gag-Pol n=1 Tax=Paramuricea clavata TaxID=317549 RepID=A0A7D9E962_PARCT|nr:Transposon Ty3-I Gag-Pol [Paramuricea clavata]
MNSNRISQDRRRSPFNRTSKTSVTTCTRFGGKHDEQQKCPAIGATCHKCKKPNHYSRMCRTRTNEKNVHSHEAEASTRNSDSESNDSFFIGAIHAQDENKEWTTSLKVNNTNVMFKIDTGAECNVISKKTYEELSKTLLEKSRTKLGAFGGQKLKTTGKFTTLCTYRDKYWPIEFQVVNHEVPNILGLTTCLQLNLVKRVLTIDKKECVELTSTAREDIFEQYSDVFTGLGIEVIVDDLLIWGETREQHDERLKQALERAREAGVKLNKDKCEIGLQQVTYIGHTLSSNGLKPDVNKVEAIKTMDTPTDKAAVQRFPGMATYLAKLIPNSSQLAAPLRMLLEKNTAWHWDVQQQNSFERLKQTITNAPVLKYYDVNKHVTIQVDASPDGLGAVLLQDERPVAYASRSLTQTQRNYA